MQATALEVRGFRNLANDRVELGDGLTLLYGPNGSGKTNLLEALYFGLAGRSFRTSRDRDVIAFGAGMARASVSIEHPGSGRTGFVASVSTGEGRRLRVDGKEMTAVSVAERRPPLSVFMPDRLVLIKGPPRARRVHLDRFVTGLHPGRADLRRRYGRALTQRNALLSRIRGGRAPAAALDDWDAELASEATPLIAARREAASALVAPFAAAARSLGLGESASILYCPRADEDPAAFVAELARHHESDISRGFSGYGPHLDEVEITLAGRPLRSYGSQGEQRLALLALLVAEREALIERGSSAPLMLLDDVMSELDSERRTRLIEWLGGAGQTVITATEPSHVPDHARIELEVRDGIAREAVAA